MSDDCRIRIDVRSEPESDEWKVWAYLKKKYRANANVMILNLMVQMYGHLLTEDETARAECQRNAIAFFGSMLPYGVSPGWEKSSDDSIESNVQPDLDFDQEEDGF